MIIPFAVHLFIYGPFPEELGWRGYVLDRLQARWNALASSLILGGIWALWHLPLFYIKDTYPHYSQGAWSPWFWLFMVEVIPTAVIYTWIFNNTRRSTLAAIIFHFMSNVTAELTNATAGTNFYSTLLWVIAALAVVALWGAGTLTRREYAASG
jgi:membrane protease YdiL (CAAX protease family)